ncbi:hypothetical protein [Kushneria pakistanensis]|uniref:hypothetical protein n=1 Tax=Kushneria pakistanensis TaxID=1508770 RepID=UPI00167920E0|nr:hypothetical protein [Kushneria pakistanensis]
MAQLTIFILKRDNTFDEWEYRSGWLIFTEMTSVRTAGHTVATQGEVHEHL